MDDSAVTARGGDNSPLGAAAGGLNDLFEVQGDVLIGPGGWMDKSGNFHEGEYTGASKRDADGLTEPQEERTFGLLLGALIGGKGGSFFHGWRRWSGCLIRPGGGYWVSLNTENSPINAMCFLFTDHLLRTMLAGTKRGTLPTTTPTARASGVKPLAPRYE